MACMEDVLDIYSWEYDETHPVVCMDEQPTQLVKETRLPLPPRPGEPKQYDFEYESNGIVNSFLFTEPQAGWRKVSICARNLHGCVMVPTCFLVF